METTPHAIRPWLLTVCFSLIAITLIYSARSGYPTFTNLYERFFQPDKDIQTARSSSAAALMPAAMISAGNLMFTHVNSDATEGFSLVATTDIMAGTVVTVTDHEWDGASFDADGSDEIYTITFTSAAPCGTEFTFTDNQAPTSNNGSTLTIDDNSFADLESGGDALYLFDGPLATPNFISAISFGSGSWGTNGSLPVTLVDNVTAIDFSADNGQYICGAGSLNTTVMDINDWTTDTDAITHSVCFWSCTVSPLNPGDIYFTHVNSDDPDGWSFVVKTPIIAGTVIFITENEWSQAGFFNTGEETYTITFTSDAPCGTEFAFQEMLAPVSNNGSTATINDNTYDFATGGEALYMYQPSPAGINFISAISFGDGAWGSNGDLPGLPVTSALINNSTAIDFDEDNGEYNCANGVSLNSDVIMNEADWTVTNTAITLNSFCAWSGCTGSDLGIMKPDGTYCGDMITLVFYVYNNGPENDDSVNVVDNFPVGWTDIIWSSSINGTMISMGNGDIDDTISLDAYDTIIYRVMANLPAMTSGTLMNTATVQGSEDTNPVNDSDTGNYTEYENVCNPPLLPVSCDEIQILLVLDASGSIDAGEQQIVREAAIALVDALTNTGASIALVQFAHVGINAVIGASSDYQVIAGNPTTAPGGATGFVADFEDYINNNYPDGTIGTFTNWEDAFLTALTLEPADLMLFMTDGDPTAFNSPSSCPECSGFDAGFMVCFQDNASCGAAALAAAIPQANTVKSEGTHLYVYAVGDAPDLANIEDISGPMEDLCPDSDFSCINENPTDPHFNMADYTAISFPELAFDLANFASEACQSDISIQKTVYEGHNAGAGCPGIDTLEGASGTQITYCFTITNIGNDTLDFVEFDDPALGINVTNLGMLGGLVDAGPGTWPLAPNEIITYYYQTTIMDSLCNIATITAIGQTSMLEVSDSDQACVEATGVDCGLCDVINGPLDPVCPGSSSAFTASITGVCDNPVYTWSVTGNVTGFTPSGASVTVTAGNNCNQTYVVSVSIACEGCNTSPIICADTVLVNDSTPPTIFCPSDTTIECTSSIDTSSLGAATATDNCDQLIAITFNDITVASQSCPQEYLINRTWTATDDCGNSSTCLQMITIDDSVAPLITCPANITVQCAAGVPAPNIASVVTSDNCGGSSTVTHVSDVTTGMTCSNRFTVIRTYQATDACGNTATCSQSIFVFDNTLPVLTCPANTTIDCSAGSGPDVTGMATATDNCGGSPTIDFVDSQPTGLCPATFFRTWTATDECGNTAQCTQTIMIDDQVPPDITCPINVTIDCSASTIPDNTGTATASDNCTLMPIVVPSDMTTSSGCAQEYIITRTWTASDFCGNTSTCVQTITVQDTTPPSISCPPDVTVQCASMVPPVSTTDPVASDNCGVAIVGFIGDVIVNQVCVNRYTINRTYQASDLCGNTATCLQVITVSDDTPPIINCPEDITIDNTEDSSPENTGTAGATDNCAGMPMVTSSDVTMEDACAGDYSITRTWTATDECGNSATCIQIIIVEGPCDVDLSLTKELNPGQGAVSGGDDVVFTITVTNEGLVPVGSITIVDYIPDGFVLNDPDWVAGMDGSTGQSASIVLSVANGELAPGGLQPMQMISIEITLQAEADITPGTYINIAEISAVFDTNGTDVSDNDVDSDPDNIDTNDPADEDDHDPALICVLPNPVITGNAFVCSGDTVTYSIVGYNSLNTYTWLLSGGGVIIENNDSSIVVAWTGAPGGPFAITVSVTSGPDCTATTTISVLIQGGDAIACLDHVNLSIDNECGTVVTSGMILTGDLTGNNGYTVYVIDMNGDTVPNATLTWMHVGQTFKVSVVSACSSQSCWGFLTVEDKLPPQINCVCSTESTAPICQISCLQIDDFLNGNIPAELLPTAVDNCGGTTIEIVNIILNFETCSGGYVLVTWLATDAAGNTSTCEQQFNIAPLTLETLDFPADYFGECSESSDPSVTGWPQVDGLDLTNIPTTCNIIASYTDNVFDLCGGGRKIIRSWSVFDWCVPEIQEFTQFIILADTTGPVLTCPAPLTVGTNVWFCYANVLVPKPIAIDDCSAIKTYQLFSPEGIVVSSGNNFFINELPIGTHIVQWTVIDECHNSSSCTFEITVIDNVPPVPSCQQHLVVSLTNDRPNGITLVPATAFDDGSFDNCSAVSFRVRRMDSCIDFDWTTGGACVDDFPGGIPAVSGRDRGTDHGICVPFACCDIGAGPIMVELEVTDAAGNVNYCMVEVTIQDKLAPTVTCPPDITVSCEFELDILEGVFSDVSGNNDGTLDEDPLSEIFGNMFDAFRHDESARGDIIINDPGNDVMIQPFNWGIDGWANDNCEINLSVEVTEYDDCSGESLPGNPPAGAVRLITRRFLAFDASGNPSPGTCLQRIWVVDFNPFYIADTTCFNVDPFDGVIWPCDVMINTCPDELTGTGEPVIFDDHCNIIGVSFEDQQFDFAEGACYKVLREWTIIDWCQFDWETGAGIWSYTQTIKVTDAEGPEMLDCPQSPVELCLNDPGVSLPENNQIFLGENDPAASSCSVHLTMSQTVRELCSQAVTYDVKLYPFNGLQFIQLKPSTVLLLNAQHEGEMSFDTKQSTIQSISEDGLPYNSAACGDYHRLLWTVEDGCGNLSFCDQLIRLEDCKDPSPVCLNGISSVIMPMNGEVTIWASDFNASSFDDCTPSNQLLFSFSGTEYQPSFTYTCDNVPVFGEEIEVEIWVADGGADQNCNGQIEWNERNSDFCVTYIIIDDNNNVCDEEGLVLGGEIMTEDIIAVGNASVRLSGPSGTAPAYLTAADGKFTFSNVVPGHDYTIRPERNDDHENGVSTLDLVRIQKHLLGKEAFTSPYQYIAADANNSGSVSAIDMIEIRKVILGLYESFPSNQSWRFVKKGSTMEPTNPWPFEEMIEIDNLSNAQLDQFDFVGVKVGDVNNTVKANALQILPRNGRAMLKVAGELNGEVKAGRFIEVKFVIPQQVEGFQWTLETHGLEFVTVKSRDIAIDDSNIGRIGNHLTMSWNGEPVIEKETISFVIEFKVTETGSLDKMLHMSSDITEAEAYTFEGEVMDVDLIFNQAPVIPEFALYQNQPNPWNNHTVIGFNLPEEADATLTVYDITGKVIKTISGSYKAGANMILLTSKELPVSGIVYYRLESGNYSATKKMIIQ